MTESTVPRRCQWCRGIVPDSAGPGRPRRYCRRSHRQRAYEARRLGRALGLRSDDVVVPAGGYRRLLDLLHVLEAALSDVERDLRGSPEPEDHRRAFQHLYAAAAGLRGAAPEPTAIGRGDPGPRGHGDRGRSGPGAGR